ncbi:Uncharacterised protein [Shigella sonnei]|nr:Uncharacterised protein [Shigella sonnei]
MQRIVQRLRGIYRIILQPLKLIYGIADRLANRSLHLCGSFRHHTNIVSMKCPTAHHLCQRTGCRMLRDTIPGYGPAEFPQLPDSDTGIMSRQRQLTVKFLALLPAVMPGFTQTQDRRDKSANNAASHHAFRRHQCACPSGTVSQRYPGSPQRTKIAARHLTD